MVYKFAVVAGYAAALGWLAYHDANPPGWVALGIWFVLPLVAGLLAGPWAAVALPVAVLVAVPAGYGTGEALVPIWVAMVIVGVVALPVIVVASFVRWAVLSYARA